MLFILDKQNKQKVVEPRKLEFSNLGLKERAHLQEWVADHPSALGEELLIIQKEFAGFSGTKERLDLLAVDKKGNLVIIENKLDDSGKDVTWQALKYASYFAKSTTAQIIAIYQKYLGTSANAESKLVEFLDGVTDASEISLNKLNSQRVFFVAGSFRLEVTSTIMWLRERHMDLQCIQVTPYEVGDRVVIEFEKIIPGKESEKYLVTLADKKTEDENASENAEKRKFERGAFWKDFIEYCKQNNGLFSSSSGTSDVSLSASFNEGDTKIQGFNVNVYIAKQKCCTLVYFYANDSALNEARFKTLEKHKSEIETKLVGYSLIWDYVEGRKTQQIRVERDLSYINQAKQEEIFQFFVNSSNKFKEVFGDYVNELSKVS
jgi:hypothetical protein